MVKSAAGIRRAGEALGQDKGQIWTAAMNHLKKIDANSRALKKATTDFKRANSRKRSLRAGGSRAKQGRLF